MLNSMRSQPLPGSENATIYSYIRKIDFMSSNSYIISGYEQIAVIDPGGLEEQIDHLEGVVELLQEERSRPIIIYLTHVHMDHWIQIKQGRYHRNLSEAALAVHAAGARALEKQDCELTLSGLLGRPMVQVPVDLKLLAPSDMSLEREHYVHRDGRTCEYAMRSLEIAPGLLLHSQTISLGKTDRLEIYHTPGHSPDSICIQAGSLMIVGDLFFAPNPGVAGACGWSQKDLVESIQKVLWILENKNVQLCCSGHGRVIDALTARKTLEIMYNETSSLQILEEITPKWVERIGAYASDLIAELERISTIIAGRLAFIAHVLSEFEENSEAEDMVSIIDPLLLDGLFNDFHGFSLALRERKRPNLELVHKAGQTVGRLEKLFDMRRLGSILDPYLLRRVSRLINDYSITYRGFRPPYYASYEDINCTIMEILNRIRRNPYDEDAILLAESVEDYLMALKARIAHVDVFKNTNLNFDPDPKRPFARMDKERFSDVLLDILERFAGAGAMAIDVRVSQKDDWVMVRIDGLVSLHPLSRSERFFERCLALCGGLMQTSNENERSIVEIEFSGLEEELAI